MPTARNSSLVLPAHTGRIRWEIRSSHFAPASADSTRHSGPSRIDAKLLITKDGQLRYSTLKRWSSGLRERRTHRRQARYPVIFVIMFAFGQNNRRGAFLAARILNGNAIRDQIYGELTGEIAALGAAGIKPGLAAVLVGDNPASKLYVNSKIAACGKLGLASFMLTPPASINTAELLRLIDELNHRDDVDGILVQMPLPSQVETKKILDAVDPAKDVDGFHPINVGRLVAGRESLVACTPAGVMEIFRRSQIPLEGANAVVMGRSDIVGKPMSLLLLHASATVTICHSKTRDLKEVVRRADIVVAAMGRAAMVTPDYIRSGATVIDVGQNVIKDRAEALRIFANFPEKIESFRAKGSVLVGDVHPDVIQTAGAFTPVPGGVGPLTIAMLMSNTVRAARMRRGGHAGASAAAHQRA
jgi:methylenetetrahydrofolate dehydrogenase (NADP+)/methenyltetrahydrofolate cyclohydrolase